jgi:hypothetical protein
LSRFPDKLIAARAGRGKDGRPALLCTYMTGDQWNLSYEFYDGRFLCHISAAGPEGYKDMHDAVLLVSKTLKVEGQ